MWSIVVDSNSATQLSTTISISAAVRKDTGLAAGDQIHVVLTLAEGSRDVAVPDDLAAALAADPAAAAFFSALSNSLQRYHVDNVNAAKTPETRQRRIDKAISLFEQGSNAKRGQRANRESG